MTEQKQVYLIAEIAQAHDGSLGILHSYIDALAETGINAIKFQTHIAEAESSPKEPFRTNFSYQDKTRFDYWKRVSFSESEWRGIKNHCDEVGLEFISSPFSIEAVKLLEMLDVKRYKVGSGEINNYLLLNRLAQTKKPIILSSGMSTLEEIEKAVKYFVPFGNSISVLQCTTSYPTPPERVGLNVLAELKQRFPEQSIGLSDHSGTIFPSLAATSLGADILEFHVTFDKRMFGPDTSSSITIDQVSELAKGVQFIRTALNNPVEKDKIDSYKELRVMFGKSLAVNKQLPSGHVLRQEDLETKKPHGEGIAASSFEEVIGKKLKVSKDKYSFLKPEDILDNEK